jgi:hypothetical protein
MESATVYVNNQEETDHAHRTAVIAQTSRRYPTPRVGVPWRQVINNHHHTVIDILRFHPCVAVRNRRLLNRRYYHVEARGFPSSDPPPLVWWLGQIITRAWQDRPSLQRVDWERLDTVSGGQVRRLLADCFAYAGAEISPTLRIGVNTAFPYPDILRFCMHLAVDYDMHIPIPANHRYALYRTPSFPLDMLYYSMMGHYPGRLPEQWENWWLSNATQTDVLEEAVPDGS